MNLNIRPTLPPGHLFCSSVLNNWNHDFHPLLSSVMILMWLSAHLALSSLPQLLWYNNTRILLKTFFDDLWMITNVAVICLNAPKILCGSMNLPSSTVFSSISRPSSWIHKFTKSSIVSRVSHALWIGSLISCFRTNGTLLLFSYSPRTLSSVCMNYYRILLLTLLLFVHRMYIVGSRAVWRPHLIP